MLLRFNFVLLFFSLFLSILIFYSLGFCVMINEGGLGIS
jgi:hypothetical protein